MFDNDMASVHPMTSYPNVAHPRLLTHVCRVTSRLDLVVHSHPFAHVACVVLCCASLLAVV